MAFDDVSSPCLIYCTYERLQDGQWIPCREAFGTLPNAPFAEAIVVIANAAPMVLGKEYIPNPNLRAVVFGCERVEVDMLPLDFKNYTAMGAAFRWIHDAFEAPYPVFDDDDVELEA